MVYRRFAAQAIEPINPFGRALVYSVNMRSAILAGIVFLAGFAAMYGQAPADKRPTFDVASIKPFEMPAPGPGGKGVFFGRGGGPGTRDPGRLNWSGATLHDLIATAYDVKRIQVTGPDWIDTERYDIVAKVPDGASKDDVKLMWQSLLAERFGLVFHREQKEFTVEELTVAKGGPKLKVTDIDANAPAPAAPDVLPPDGPKRDANGFPQLDRPGQAIMISPGPNGQPLAHLVAKAQTMANLADLLGMQLNKPVVDKTGLTQKYDYNIEFTPDLSGMPAPPPGAFGPPPGATAGDAAAEPGTNLVAAIQQLGLRLNSTKGKLDVLVIDKAVKTPTEN